MVLDPEVEAAYPKRWIGKVEIETVDGRRIASRVDEPKGDPGNTLSRQEINDKVAGLVDFSGALPKDVLAGLLPRLWDITASNRIGRFVGR